MLTSVNALGEACCLDFVVHNILDIIENNQLGAPLTLTDPASKTTWPSIRLFIER